MIKHKSVLLILIVFCFTGVKSENIFQCKDKHGNKVFQDSPCKDKQALVSKSKYTGQAKIKLEGCKLFGLPSYFQVIAAGTKSGSIPLKNVSLGKSGYEVGQQDVSIVIENKPLVIALLSDKPVVWNVKRSLNTKLLAIIVGSDYKSAVLGVEDSVPVFYLDKESNNKCGSLSAYRKDSRLTWVSNRLKRIVGREIDHFYSELQGTSLKIGEKKLPSYQLISFNDVELNDFIDPSAPLYGKQGIKALLKENLIREATKYEKRTWISKSIAWQKSLGVKKPESFLKEYEKVFVVLDAMKLPDNLNGANSVKFLIPEGIPMPAGPRGHNSFYFMEDGRCEGPFCEHYIKLLTRNKK